MKYYEVIMAGQKYEVYPQIASYDYNDRLAIRLYTRQGEAFGNSFL